MPMTPRHLDPKVKWVWFLPILIGLLVAWAALSAFVAWALPADASVIGMSKGAFPTFLFLFFLIFLAGPAYAYYHIEYMSFTYELAAEEFVIRQGVFTRDTTVIPYMRIQNINTRRTVFERALGLATLQIDTAGTNVNAAEGVLPGVSNKEALIRELMDRVEKAKNHDGTGSTHPGHDRSERQLLADILKEIVQLNHNLQQLSASRGKARSEDAPPSPANWSKMLPQPPALPRPHKKP